MKMKKYLFLLLMTMPLMFAGCGSDDDDTSSISKSELIGTWYTLEDDWVMVFTESDVTQYEIWHTGGVYSLNSYTISNRYTLSGNKLIIKDGPSVTVSVNDNKLMVSSGGKTLIYTKYNGTPQQLMDYLNK